MFLSWQHDMHTLIFQAKCSEPSLTDRLQKVRNIIISLLNISPFYIWFVSMHRLRLNYTHFVCQALNFDWFNWSWLQGKETILRIARELAETERDCGIDTSLDDYERSLKFGLVEVVYEWANGKVQYCLYRKTCSRVVTPSCMHQW